MTMVTFRVEKVRTIHDKQKFLVRFIGRESDMQSYNQMRFSIDEIMHGSTFVAMDTAKVYIFDEENRSWGIIRKPNKTYKLRDHTYFRNYTTLDYANGESYFLNRYNPMGACSGMVSGGYFGRNYDYYYDNKATVIVHHEREDGKFASIGVSSSFLDDELATDDTNEQYKYLPFIIVDGINENRVAASVNMIPSIDRKGITTGTNPGKPDIPMACVIRRLMDESTSASDAVNRLCNEYNIKAPTAPGYEFELHYMITDPNETYVVEFINNEPTVIRTFIGNKPIYTNFYLNGVTLNNGSLTGLTPHANGVERYNELYARYDSIHSARDMSKAMQAVRYTQMYQKDRKPFWYSEYYGDWSSKGLGDFNINSDVSLFKPAIDEYIDEIWPPSSLDDHRTWQTVHSSVYDIQNGILYISTREEPELLYFSM